MKKTGSIVRSAGASLVALVVLIAAQAATASSESRDYRFRVLLNDDEIGTHSFRLRRDEQRDIVEINADFAVKFLGITVYTYDHDNRESWRDGCLQQIVSSTDDNGDEFVVNGKVADSGFSLVTQQGERELDAECVMSFAYWRRDYLEQPRLLNAQNGEYLPIEVEKGGVERLRFDEREIAAERYRLRNVEKDIDITVWYAQDSGEWLGLESRVDGRVIRYLPLDVTTMARVDQPVDEKSARSESRR